MNKITVLKGFILGLLISLIGCFFFIYFFTNFNFIKDLAKIKSQGYLGKIITLGSILDLLLFGFLLKINKDLMARGVVLAVIAVAIITLFV